MPAATPMPMYTERKQKEQISNLLIGDQDEIVSEVAPFTNPGKRFQSLVHLTKRTLNPHVFHLPAKVLVFIRLFAIRTRTISPC